MLRFIARLQPGATAFVAGFCFLSVGASSVHAELLTVNDSFDIPFVDNTSNGQVFLSAFDPELGTLTSVQILMTLQVNTITDVINNEFTVFDPLVGPAPTAISGLASGTTVLTLNANGFPVFNDAVTSPPLPFFVDLASTGTATTVNPPITATIDLPSFDVSSFSTPGLAPLDVSAQEFMMFTTMAINPGVPVGSVTEESTLTDLTGSLTAFYTYTPVTPAPEPSYGGAMCAALLLILAKKGRAARGKLI